MYVVLTPFEKLAYLSFWRPRTSEEAWALSGKDGPLERMEAAADKLAGLGLLKKRDGRFAAERGYLAERIEEDNHLYPDLPPADADLEALLALLRSELLAGWFEEDFARAIALEKEGKDVLAGYFWAVMRGPFGIAHAYFLVFADQPDSSAVGRDFDEFLKLEGERRGKERGFLKKALEDYDSRTSAFTKNDPRAIERAFRYGFAFAIPAGLVGFLRWNVNISPSAFVAEDIFKRARARIPR